MSSSAANQTLAGILVVEGLHVVTVLALAAGIHVLAGQAGRHADRAELSGGLEVVTRVAELAVSRSAGLAAGAVGSCALDADGSAQRVAYGASSAVVVGSARGISVAGSA
jgi:hypothetical protein